MKEIAAVLTIKIVDRKIVENSSEFKLLTHVWAQGRYRLIYQYLGMINEDLGIIKDDLVMI